jgi:hypothetical protein
MTSGEGAAVRRTRWIRWIARGLGTLLAGFWLFIGSLLATLGSEPWTPESAVMATLIIASALAVLVAWWREGIGAILVIVAGVAHCVFAFVASGRNTLFAVFISGVPFLLVGVLFLVSWRQSERGGTDRNESSNSGKEADTPTGHYAHL